MGDTKDENDIDWESAIFHEEHAAELGELEAMVTMAKLYLGQERDVLVNCVVEVRVTVNCVVEVRVTVNCVVEVRVTVNCVVEVRVTVNCVGEVRVTVNCVGEIRVTVMVEVHRQIVDFLVNFVVEVCVTVL